MTVFVFVASLFLLEMHGKIFGRAGLLLRQPSLHIADGVFEFVAKF